MWQIRHAVYVRRYLLADTWWAWVIYPLAWHSSLVQRKRFFEVFFLCDPVWVCFGRCGRTGVGQCRLWTLRSHLWRRSIRAFASAIMRGGMQTAHGAEYNLVCFNCNHFAARVLSRLGLSAWRRWLVLGLVASMVPLGYQVPGTRAWQTIIGTSGIGTTYRLDYWCSSTLWTTCPTYFYHVVCTLSQVWEEKDEDLSIRHDLGAHLSEATLAIAHEANGNYLSSGVAQLLFSSLESSGDIELEDLITSASWQCLGIWGLSSEGTGGDSSGKTGWHQIFWEPSATDPTHGWE